MRSSASSSLVSAPTISCVNSAATESPTDHGRRHKCPHRCLCRGSRVRPGLTCSTADVPARGGPDRVRRCLGGGDSRIPRRRGCEGGSQAAWRAVHPPRRALCPSRRGCMEELSRAGRQPTKSHRRFPHRGSREHVRRPLADARPWLLSDLLRVARADRTLMATVTAVCNTVTPSPPAPAPPGKPPGGPRSGRLASSVACRASAARAACACG
jgi:hypothetical protein